jgi:hypothetical protein
MNDDIRSLQTAPATAQGRSVFHNAQELEEFEGAVGEVAEGGGDFFVAAQAEEVDGGVAKCGQVLRGVSELDLALVLAERHVADPVQAFDPPMALPAGHQQGRVGALAREAADRVLHLDRVLTLGVRAAFQAADLLQPGPVQMFGQASAGLEVPLYQSSVPFARSARFRE